MNIIEELYFGNLCEFSRHKKSDNTQKQIELYDKIKECLGSENENLLDELLDLECDDNEKLLLARYSNGFKTGLLIGLEVCNFDI